MVVRLQFGVVTVLLAMVASSSSIRVSGDQNYTFRALALRFPPSLSDGQQHEARSRGRNNALPTPLYNYQFDFFVEGFYDVYTNNSHGQTVSDS